MIRALMIASLCLALAAPASAQQADKSRLTAVKPSAEALALRGPLTADPLAARAEARDSAAPAPDPIDLLGPAPDPPGAAAGQCRQACARSYYFCLAADTGADCGANWAQCRSDCNADDPLQPLDVRPTP